MNDGLPVAVCLLCSDPQRGILVLHDEACSFGRGQTYCVNAISGNVHHRPLPDDLGLVAGLDAGLSAITLLDTVEHRLQSGDLT